MPNTTTTTTRTLLLGMLVMLYSIHMMAQKTTDQYPLTVTQALQQETIAEQFDYIVKKSNRFKDFKVIKRVFMNQLKKNTLDSIKTLESKITTSNTLLAKQKTIIQGLETSLAATNQNLDTVTQEKDNMNFLGIAFTKKSYKSLMWTISSILLALLLFFIYKFKNSNTVTVTVKKTLAETELEFEDHRRKALEREQKLNRKLQDEINKQRNKTV